MSAERDRVASFGQLEYGLLQASDWYHWGPYVSERQWGTVREDYSPGGNAWSYFPHDQARSRAYRWGEDGLAGFCDARQRLCLGLALWNGRDPILKERAFGLAGPEGNHGEDVKEYWWYLDAVPSHAWNRWRYHYPQAAFPYTELLAENARRGRYDPEYELADTGVFDDRRYWVVEVDYAKADPHDLLMTVRVTNRGPDPDTVHVLPTAWFRNTWSWEGGADKPQLRAAGGDVAIDHPFLGPLELLVGPAPDGRPPELLFCENETNIPRLFGAAPSTPYPKDGINDHVLHGVATVNPQRVGTKVAAWYRCEVAPGVTVELRLRLRPRAAGALAGAAAATRADRAADLGSGFAAVVEQRRREADEFYRELAPASLPADRALVMRQAFAGLLWGKQFYAYDVARWLDGDPAQPPPPAARRGGRNSRWRTFDAFDIISMPDSWEYPWFAAWDLAFHCVTLAHVDPAFAKYQLVLLCREWFQHPDGALPAYEWAFDDVNPPVHAWAALEVFAIDGARDVAFLRRVFDKLLVNFTWWVNREDVQGNQLYQGGFLGLDNIGPIDRSHLPVAGQLQQCDATAWMAFYALHMDAIAGVLSRAGEPTTDLRLKFLEHFALIRSALETGGLWDNEDGFFYDRFVTPDGQQVPVRVRSMAGVLPVLATLVVEEPMVRLSRELGKQFADLLDSLHGQHVPAPAGASAARRRLLLGVVDRDRSARIFQRLFDEAEFLSPHGTRALSRYHLAHPGVLDVEGLHATVDYEPAESHSSMFGGNSNWRGPVWFPLNVLLISAIDVLGTGFGDTVRVEYPTGSGRQATFGQVAHDLRNRLIALFLPGPDGRRPFAAGFDRFRDDPGWQGLVQFNEYFHGDTGAGLGASHQTGWTGAVADLILRAANVNRPRLADVLDL